MGVRGRMVGCVLDLFCWQTAHPSTYLHTKDARSGHQNSEATSWWVFKYPGWPAVSWSWQQAGMARWREGSEGM